MSVGNRSAVVAAVLGIIVVACESAPAQGLIFNLPQDGIGIEYEGTFVQENFRPDIPDGKEVLSFTRELSIKSVGREDAEFEGTRQPCRWIEIKTVTGTAGAAGIDPGPVGATIYKVLIPESKVIDTAVDADSIPNDQLPIVKGFQRLGENPVKPMTSRALRVYPTMTQLTNYSSPEVVTESEVPQTKAGQSFPSKHLKGELTIESTRMRSTNTGDYWVAADVPFGLVRWEVKVTQEEKESTAPRDQFREVAAVTTVMSVKRILNNAESELVVE
ncbi:MAG: hypothetical protein R3C19_11450 [Planctomycetaceae bacterium]